ncbi:Serpentine receptor class r-10 [Caenorhabditis elegans]|uniref:Serpentine receptor class r-10 n=1 Tax=Caenorhabditis elegans TaxID=6239 RepID=Q21937_CAEEL|nr:Seven TM Receptor [Caenorhabditis elegans]CAA99904.2 Seven TM Receptor [Caenorhabditis elegans]|eukprot:NP_506177.2 Seven TM Receptor [Caenorhabditis elegans]
MLQSGWSLFCGHLQNVCVCLTIILNCYMIYLIINKSPKKIGNYKYLMLYISFFEITYAILATVTKPFVHSYTSRVIVIVDAKSSWFNRDVTKILNSCICGFYGCSVTILAIHFIYRYGSLHKTRRTLFEGWKFIAWCLVPIFYGIVWGLTIFFIFPEDKGFTELIRKDIWDYFELSIEDIVYTGPYYYPEDKNGIHGIEPLAVFGMLVLWFVIVSSSLAVMFYGFRCYRTMSELLSRSTSTFAQGLQQQLFKALVWQTIIPLIMLYVPCSIVFMCPLLQINIGNCSAFITVSVAVYPAVDTLPNIFIIKNFKETTLDLLCCGHQKSKSSSSSKTYSSKGGINITTT